MNEIVSGLFLSSARAAQDKALLQRNKIAHILNVASKLPRMQLSDIAVIPLHFPHDPSPSELARCIRTAVVAIAQARKTNKNVLVQCECDRTNASKP
jgi:protein-tyrosine phosphatase